MKKAETIQSKMHRVGLGRGLVIELTIKIATLSSNKEFLNQFTTVYVEDLHLDGINTIYKPLILNPVNWL